MRNKWALAGLAAVILLAALAVFLPRLTFYYRANQINPDELMSQALKNTAAANSFRYTLESLLLIENRREVISRVEGEKSEEGNIHIKGEMVKTPVDIYHFNQTVYNWDSFSKRWLEIKDSQSNPAKVLISELDPLSNFHFKNVGEVHKVGWGNVDRSRCMIINCRPSVENELMEILWQDFRYKIWIDAEERVIRKATLSAVSKNNPDTKLQLSVSFKDYGKTIRVEKPDIP